jgi:serine/threonine protein kinase
MSPQQLDGSKAPYDGRKADAWACGVMLLVMLLGEYPFSNGGNADARSEAARQALRRQQMASRWRDQPRIVPGLQLVCRFFAPGHSMPAQHRGSPGAKKHKNKRLWEFFGGGGGIDVDCAAKCGRWRTARNARRQTLNPNRMWRTARNTRL